MWTNFWAFWLFKQAYYVGIVTLKIEDREFHLTSLNSTYSKAFLSSNKFLDYFRFVFQQYFDWYSTNFDFLCYRVLQEVLPIPNSNVKLVYHSGRARGYLSTIELRLTPEVIPKTLKTISLRITIEGVLFEKTFEADPDLKYTYSWNRLNIYRWVEKKVLFIKRSFFT